MFKLCYWVIYKTGFHVQTCFHIALSPSMPFKECQEILGKCVLYFLEASQSRARRRIYIKYINEENTSIKEGKRDFSNELWAGRRISYKWSFQKVMPGQLISSTYLLHTYLL